MPRAPRITVAMSVFNDARHVGEAIESVLGQSFGDFEFLIVNDGSRDASPGIIDAFASRDPRVRAIHQDNRGLIASLNRLIALARAPLIARMDGDDVALPERFAQQIDWLNRHPDVGVLGGQAEEIDAAGRRRGPARPRPTSPDNIAAELDTESPLIHPSVMMRTALVRSLGGYRAAYSHCEDYDLWLRARERTRLANLPVPLILYRRSPDQVSNRHVVAQHYGTLVARAAAARRLRGLPDPTDELATLPPLDAIDAAFSTPGLARGLREQLAHSLVYSREALSGDGFDIIAQQITTSGPHEDFWRLAARLVRMRKLARAARLTGLLLINSKPSDPST